MMSPGGGMDMEVQMATSKKDQGEAGQVKQSIKKSA